MRIVASGAAMSWRVTQRLLRLLGLILIGVGFGTVIILDADRFLPRERINQWWQRRLLKILGIRLRIHGRPLRAPHLTVSNHVSWLDIPVLAAAEPMRFVSKAEVARWFVAGRLADAAGTLYLKRGAGGTKLLIDTMAKQLQKSSIAFYPEGTTTEGDRLLRFQPRLFAAAIQGHCLVQPVAVCYGLSLSGKNVAPFIGDDALTSHVFRLLREPFLTVDLYYLRPLDPTVDSDRSSLAQKAQAMIAEVVTPQAHAADGRRTSASLAA